MKVYFEVFGSVCVFLICFHDVFLRWGEKKKKALKNAAEKEDYIC